MVDLILSVSDLTKRFGALVANDRVELEVERGEIHAIIGPNGAGKTTFINQLSGEMRTDEGRIVFDGRDVTRDPIYKRARLGLARSYQITSIIPSFTALDNVALAAQAMDGHSYRFWKPARSVRHLNEKAAAILDSVGFGERKSVLARNLAHGEHRQLEIAMALATNPKMLLLDEPAAGMGPSATEAMIGFLATLKPTYSILLIEHDMDVVFTLADRISVLVNGRTIATGTPTEIRGNPEVRRAYLGDKADALAIGGSETS
jgi:branched-chain amino acid transport system ATP-binding protein